MNAERLMALFERISEAPDAIPRLRRFILDLAVRGKLVEQDSENEPAEELLQRLKRAKALAYELEGLRKRQPVSSVSRGDLWFDMPADWALPCFDDLFVIVSGITKGQRIPPSEVVEVPYLRVANVQRGSLDLSQIKTISVRAADVERYSLKSQDVLMTEGGDWDKLGRAAIWADQIPGCIHQNHVFRLRVPTDELMPEWVVLYANSDPGRKFFEDCSKQTTNLASINLTQLRSCPLPLPPLAEQHRIVAKVDELMLLCDQLEAARHQREQSRNRLMAATLQRLNQPSDDPDTFRHDARFALQVLPSLTATPAQIKQLRQTILDLAVRGKLVEQNPEDEPAIITITEALLAAANSPRKKSRRKASWTPCLENNNKELPVGWHLFSLAELVDPAAPLSYGVLVPGDNVTDGVPFVRAQDLMLKNHPVLPGKKIAQEIEGDYARTRLTGGEILICVVGSIGKIGIVPEHWSGANLARAVARLKLIPEVSAAFMLLALQSGMIQGFFKDSTRTLAQPTLNISLIKATPIPLPPLAEQQRIVAKVDALMGLCDQLEQQLSQAEQSRRGLLEAALAGRLQHQPEERHAAIA